MVEASITQTKSMWIYNKPLIILLSIEIGEPATNICIVYLGIKRIRFALIEERLLQRILIVQN